MNILQLNKQYLKAKNNADKYKNLADKYKNLLVEKLNEILKQTHNKNVSSCYNIQVNTITFAKDHYYFLAGIKCIEIWETGEGDSEYAKNYYFPISYLKIKDKTTLGNIWKESIRLYQLKLKEEDAKRKELIKQERETNEHKEYLRLKRKFNKQ